MGPESSLGGGENGFVLVGDFQHCTRTEKLYRIEWRNTLADKSPAVRQKSHIFVAGVETLHYVR